jgi:hypothetical protein
MWFSAIPFAIQFTIVLFAGLGLFAMLALIGFAIYKRVKIKLPGGVEIDPENEPQQEKKQ